MTMYPAVKGPSNMASKHKITTYFSNTTTYDWVTNTAAEQGLTKSGYLEGLIRQEMERNQEKTIIKSGIMIYEPYKIQGQHFILASQCNINVMPFRSVKEREEYHNKTLNSDIDASIYNDFNNEVTIKHISLPRLDYFVILLKTELEGRVFIRNENLFNIIYYVNYHPIIITQELWIKHGGYYDFFNINYLRQTNLISKNWQQGIAKRYTGFAPIDDRKKFCKDKNGFFIPVLREPVSWNEIVNKKAEKEGLFPGGVIIRGITTAFSQERFNLKDRKLLKEPYQLS
ncbi:hypothetical protein PJ912_03350 [Pectobacterium colocasium]|uniref:hypothetical protein n=1 Tax=Pectobacterium TaxID=122277 RepID=UPI003D704411|nr:hypothetical protein KXZ65_03190 [Pectobacterium sp. PL152]